MKCPLCKAPTDVEETRSKVDNSIVRRRLCFNDHSFYTKEVPTTEPKPKRKFRKAVT